MKLTTFWGENLNPDCIGCYVGDETNFQQGRICQTKFWNLGQDIEIAYPGMLVFSPLRHIFSFDDLTPEEFQEWQQLMIKSKQAIREIFGCEKVAYAFYESANLHIHFIIIPLHGEVKVQDKYAIIRELMDRADELRENQQNLKRVFEVLAKMRQYFAKN